MKRFSVGLLSGLMIGLLLATTTFAFASQPIKLVVNGKEIVCDSLAFIKDGRTFVPIRFVAEALGAKVEWDGATNSVVITTAEKISSPLGGSPMTYSIGESIQLDEIKVVVHNVDYLTYPSGEKRHWVMTRDDYRMCLLDLEYTNITDEAIYLYRYLPFPLDESGKVIVAPRNVVRGFAPEENFDAIPRILAPGESTRFKFDIGIPIDRVPLKAIRIDKAVISLLQ